MESTRVVDVHTHFAGILYPQAQCEEQEWHGAEELLSSMDSNSVDVSIVSSLHPMYWYNWQGAENGERRCWRFGGNEEVLQAIERYPERLVGSYVPNAFAPEKQVRADLSLFIEKHGFRQIKLHPWLSGYPANAAILNPIFDMAAQLHIPILYHSGTIPYTTPAEILDMALKFPQASIIMGHAGKADLLYDALVAAKCASNLYIESSGQRNKVFLEKCISELGAERILFGSDWIGSLGKLPFRRIEIEILDISRSKKELILSKNAMRLFRLDT